MPIRMNYGRSNAPRVELGLVDAPLPAYSICIGFAIGDESEANRRTIIAEWEDMCGERQSESK